MNIRLAVEKDYEAVLILMRQLNPDDPLIDVPLGRKIFTGILKADGLFLYVAEVDDKPVATCYLNIVPNLTRAGQSYALIENVVTDLEYQRRGIGTSLLKDVISKAFGFNCYKVMLLTGRDNNVHTFYENCGLEKNSKTAFIIRSAT